VIDFSEKKLMKLHRTTTDPVRKLSLAALIEDYRSGFVAMAWHKGNDPVSIKVTKDR
jgi:myo-inositol catabolism protein IolC